MPISALKRWASGEASTRRPKAGDSASGRNGISAIDAAPVGSGSQLAASKPELSPQYGEVIGLSLGADCTLRLRRRTDGGFERRAVPLPARSLYRLSGEVRWDWEHSIVPLEATRRSVTFRTLR